MARLSGLQRDVLSLYRDCIRAARQKPPNTKDHFVTFARDEFRKTLTLDKKDFGAIEYLIRKGRRQLEYHRSPQVRNVSH